MNKAPWQHLLQKTERYAGSFIQKIVGHNCYVINILQVYSNFIYYYTVTPSLRVYCFIDAFSLAITILQIIK